MPNKPNQPHVLAAYLAHPFLDMPKEFCLDDENHIYTSLKVNKAIFRTVSNLWRSEYDVLKKELIFLLIRKNQHFAKTYGFAFFLKKELLQVAESLNKNGVESIFIKSFNALPLDSDNFDVLVKEQDLNKAREILENLGFIEVTWVREPNKWLFRLIKDCRDSIAIHLHTKVCWEGIEFVNINDLWNRRWGKKIDDVDVSFPSPEHHLLITLSHAFFENQCFKLGDLMYIVEDVRCNDKMDWNYVADWVISDQWFTPFYALLRLADHVYESLFADRLIEKEVYMMLARKNKNRRTELTKKLIDQFNKRQLLPMHIPNSSAAFSFINKVFKTSNESFSGKMSKIFSTSWHYIRRRMPLGKKPEGSPSLLVCFSGQDGTGKTTHAKYVCNELKRRNVTVNYVWSRGTGLSIDPIVWMVRWLLLGSNFSAPNKGEYASKRESLLMREPIKTLWAYVTLTDELLQLLIKARIPLLLGHMVICDRYIYDALADVKCDMGKNVSRIVEGILEYLAPKPQITFIMETTPEEIMRRKEGLKSNMIRCKKLLYARYSCREKTILIDTGKRLQRNRKEILSSVLRTYFSCSK